MLIMRTFALYERNKKILALTVLVTLAAFIFAVVSSCLLRSTFRET